MTKLETRPVDTFEVEREAARLRAEYFAENAPALWRAFVRAFRQEHPSTGAYARP